MDGDGVQVVQVNNSLDVELAWHLNRHVRSDQNLEDIFNEKYAIKLMEWKEKGHGDRNEKFFLTDAVRINILKILFLILKKTRKVFMFLKI